MTTTTPELATREQIAEIARLNDAARAQRLRNSKIVFTRSLLDTLVNHEPAQLDRSSRLILTQSALIRKLRTAEFNPDNDPHGEHDFGSFEFQGHKIFWKIDTYQNDGTFQWGADKPHDEATSYRIVTIMLASDY